MTAVVVVDDSRAQATLNRLLRSVSDQRPLFESIGFAFSNIVRGRFDTTRDPWGQPWAPLSLTTIQRRRQGSSQPLSDKGMLRSSVEYIATSQQLEINVGRDDRPASPHQFGNPSNRMFGRGEAPIPARAMLPIRVGGQADLTGTEEEDVLLDLMDAYLQKAAA